MNIIKALIRRTILLLPRGDQILARIIHFKNGLYFTTRDSGVSEPVIVNQPPGPKGLFTEYYRNNFWGNKESVSGAGSTLEYTENIRREIPGLLEEYKIKKFLDAPCGDYNWFQAVKRPQGMEYLGGDIVEELIKQNQAKYGDDHTRFFFIDVISDALPHADLWMCRDCLFHFSYEDIFKTMSNFLRSDINYIFTSVHTDCTANADITTGGARQLNLELPPFNLCKPILYIDDWIPGYTVRRMGLWEKSMIAESVAANAEILKASVNPIEQRTR